MTFPVSKRGETEICTCGNVYKCAVRCVPSMDKRFSASSSGDSSKNGHYNAIHERPHGKASRTSSCDIFDLACKVGFCRFLFFIRFFVHVEKSVGGELRVTY